jgi:hypothetical protein
MKALSQPDLPLSQALLNWGADLVTRAATAMRPKHRAEEIAAIVAASNNPSGA